MVLFKTYILGLISAEFEPEDLLKKCFINAFRTLNTEEYLKKVAGVPCNMEIFKSLNINNICIMDSYAHLSSSLSKLMFNLTDDKKIT